MANTVLNTIEKHIKATLKANTSIVGLVGSRIYRNHAPVEAEYPLIVYFLQPGTSGHQNGVGGTRICSYATYAVYAISRLPASTEDEADGVAALIDEVLDGSQVDPICIVENEAPVSRNVFNQQEGIEYEERGGLYKFILGSGS